MNYNKAKHMLVYLVLTGIGIVLIVHLLPTRKLRFRSETVITMEEDVDISDYSRENNPLSSHNAAEHEDKSKDRNWIRKPEKVKIQVKVAKDLLKRARMVGPCLEGDRSNMLCARPRNVEEYKPIQFMNESKNPCVLIEKTSSRLVISNATTVSPDNADTRIGCLPGVYIMGVAKCGTSDLHSRLSGNLLIHPGVFKEVDWWAGGRRYQKEYFRKKNLSNPLNVYAYMNMFRSSLSKYQLCFNRIREKHMERNETSPGNLNCKDLLLDSSPCNSQGRTVNKIHYLTPTAKLIYILRDPVEKVLSSYRFSSQLYRSSNVQSPKGFHKYIVNKINGYKGQFLRTAIYAKSIRQALSVFPRDNILVIRFEDYIGNPESYMRKHVLPFLGLPPTNRKPSHKVANQSVRKYSMKAETRAILREAYRPHNHELAELLGDRKWTWGY